MTSKKDKLVLGCGKNELGDRYVHLDKEDLSHVDVQHDLNTGSLPFQENRFKFIKARHVLEHVIDEAYVDLLEEIARVAKEGAIFYVVVPHFLSWNSATPDHEREYGRNSFNVFTESHDFCNDYPNLFKVENIHYDFLDHEFVNNRRKIYSDETVAKFYPNTVNEIVFELKVIADQF